MSDPKERPILMMGEMVRATLEDRKLQTRRVVKIPPRITKRGIHPRMDEWMPGRYFHGSGQYQGGNSALTGDQPPSLLITCMDGTCQHLPCPYGVPGDRLWVRETWAHYQAVLNVRRQSGASFDEVQDGAAAYRSDGHDSIEDLREHLKMEHGPSCEAIEINGDRWRPSIYMPRWASRIDLEVTAVRVERVQEISTTDAMAEGVAPAPATGIGPSYTRGFHRLWNAINAKPKPCYGRIEGKRVITHYESFPWEDNEETRVHRGKPWIVSGNPHVWVVEFKRVER